MGPRAGAAQEQATCRRRSSRRAPRRQRRASNALSSTARQVAWGTAWLVTHSPWRPTIQHRAALALMQTLVQVGRKIQRALASTSHVILFARRSILPGRMTPFLYHVAAIMIVMLSSVVT